MKRITVITMVFIWGSLFTPVHGFPSSNLHDQVSDILRHKITFAPAAGRLICRKELLCGPSALFRFYAGRDFRPAWSNNTGPLPQAMTLAETIHEADREGLRSEDYHIVNIESLLREIDDCEKTNRPLNPEMLADLDVLLTDAFLLYGSHLLIGHVNPETIQSEWLIESRETDLVAILEKALDANDIGTALSELRPSHPGYARLKEALVHYQKIMQNGGWPEVPRGPKMEQGDQGPRVRALRSRLISSGDLDQPLESITDLFDQTLEHAVRRFQERHGLEVDGVVGRDTLRSLNTSAKQRVGQIKTNLERWRWLPHNLGWRYILVNIANFELDAVQNGQIVMTMRVVVGRRYRRTPVFTGNMTHLELNPYWNIPTKIAVRDILPKIQNDLEYLTRQNIRVFQSWELDAPEINPASIDWFHVTPTNLSFKFRQEPGPRNALGRVKFMFPNKFSVYLHDTPAHALFQKRKRTFSSGCIRVEKPIELTAYLLRGDPEWTHERIVTAIDSGETQIVRLPEPIPVHLLYWTAWVDADGKIHFRDDIYGRDKKLGRVLRERPPIPERQRGP